VGVTVAAEVVVDEDLEVVAEDLEDLEMTAVEAVMEAVGASEERDQGTPGLETGSVTLRTAATRTSPGGTSATSARLPSQRGPETAEEVALEAGAEAVEVSEEECGVDHAVAASVEVFAEASGVDAVVTEAVVCVVGVAAEVVGVAEVVDRPMVKVAPKNQKSIQQQKVKESRSTLKRIFNACVKEKK